MIRVIEELQNDFIEHLKEVLYNAFYKRNVKFNIEFFLGRNELGENFICLSISSNSFGIIYRKAMRVFKDELTDEAEYIFIEMLKDNMMILGMEFMIDNVIALPLTLKQDGKIERFTLNLN